MLEHAAITVNSRLPVAAPPAPLDKGNSGNQPGQHRTLHCIMHAVLLILFLLATSQLHRLTPAKVQAQVPPAFHLMHTNVQHSLNGKEQKFLKNIHVGEKGCDKLPSMQWFRNYTVWHTEQLKNPAKAKFLLYLCGQPAWPGAGKVDFKNGNIHFCSGMGDRIRGMVEMLRLAAYSDRVLLFHWSHPMKLETVWDPADIDWRVKDEYNLTVEGAPVIKWDNQEAQPEELKDGSWKQKYADSRLVIMRLKQGDAQLKYWPTIHGGFSEERSCAYRALFKPSAAVEQKVAEQRTKLMGDAEKPYVAVHLRLGGFQGEKSDIVRFDHFKGTMSALVCARLMAQANNITDAPILLLTDNELLRRMVHEGYFAGVVGPNMDVPAAHLDKNANAASHITSFVDVTLLSRAACFLRSPSGFSSTAWYLGHNKCTQQVRDCLDAVSG